MTAFSYLRDYESEYGLYQQFLTANSDERICLPDQLHRTPVFCGCKFINAEIYFDRFLKDPSRPFYMLTDDFSKKLDTLSGLKLIVPEMRIVDMLKLSARIYRTQSHELRVQLMKHQLMEVYGNWEGKRSLFKYGANHLSKAEGFLELYDIGNLVANLNDANYKKSIHIMILGISGTQASPFEGFPKEDINPDSEIMKTLRPITRTVDGPAWHCYDLLPLKTELDAGRLIVKDVKLQRIIRGYDLLVIIPKVTASEFAKVKYNQKDVLSTGATDKPRH